jgi:hypothetical protein
MPIFEAGLDDVVATNIRAGQFSFTDDSKALSGSINETTQVPRFM